MDVIQVHHECHIREPKANWTKHLPHEPSETICRKTQEMEINTLGKCIDRYQFCLQESSWTSGEFKKNVTVDFRSLGCDRRQRYLNHACHASTFENGIFINAHIALAYLGLCWLTFNCFFFCSFLDSRKIWAAFKTFSSHIWHLDRNRMISLWTNIVARKFSIKLIQA